MPRVLAAFSVCGALEGLTTAELTVHLSVLDDGSLLGAVEPAGWLVEAGKAAIDYCESTAVTTVYSCRFILVQWDHEQATRTECIGRVSVTNGLAGRWRRVNQEGDDDVVMEIPFHMAMVVPVARREQIQEDDEETEEDEVHVLEEDNQSVPPPQERNARPQRRTREPKRKRDKAFRGNTIDAQGEIYETTLFLTFWDEWKVTGVAHESCRECLVEGTWSGCYMQYRLTYPHTTNGTYYYEYQGVLRDDEAGGARFVGSWKFDNEASLFAVHEVLEGTFDFRREDGAPARNTRSRNRGSGAPKWDDAALTVYNYVYR